MVSVTDSWGRRMDFDGKRDRWNGYSLDKHQEIVEEFQKIEEVWNDTIIEGTKGR